MRISLDKCFMEVAEVVAKRSTCLHRYCGAVIVKGKQIVSTGYNGAPKDKPHCIDIGFCARDGIPSGQNMELCRGAHAEQNAINFAAKFGIAIEGAALYSTHFPCSWCGKSIINSGIAKVVYKEEYPDMLSGETLVSIEVEKVR